MAAKRTTRKSTGRKSSARKGAAPSRSGKDGSRKTFPGISPRAWEHPADRAALVALRRMRGFDTVLRKVMGALGDRRLRMFFLANAVRVNSKQLPDVDRMLTDACRVLDLPARPELYIHQNPRVNAMAIGVDQPFIVIHSSLIRMMNEDELRCVLGHEVAHILSGHALYHTMLFVLLQALRFLFPLPLAGVVLPVLLALQEWSRKSELSADRAGLLITQDLVVSQTVDMKLAGGVEQGRLDLEEFERQAQEYEEGGSIGDNFFKLLNLLWQSHPFPVLRIAELRKWAESKAYRSILDGEYPERDGDEAAELQAEVEAAARHYRTRFHEARDSLSDLVRGAVNVGQSAITTLFAEPDDDLEDEDVFPSGDVREAVRQGARARKSRPASDETPEESD